MLHVTRIRRRGEWPVGTESQRITLAFEERYRRRMQMHTDGGVAFLLDLAEATRLDDGDALELEDGGLIAVHAAGEALVEVTAASPQLLLRLAWHLGNRHVPVEILPDSLMIREDHVLVAMLADLGAHLRFCTAPFSPEGGAHEGTAHRHGPPHD